MTVAVIGSARLNPPDPRCALAEQLGAAIARQGWTVVTGGYGGLMEVTSRAAAEAGGTVIGLPMRGWSELAPNRWNHELRWSDTYAERLAHLLAADAVVAVDGGIGTWPG
ncbi:MAG TPA: LOG family protein [Streptosporangiaceae bacterium]|nr:LOG family protein [Streptosporangiaceae bacterium]